MLVLYLTLCYTCRNSA